MGAINSVTEETAISSPNVRGTLNAWDLVESNYDGLPAKAK